MEIELHCTPNSFTTNLQFTTRDSWISCDNRLLKNGIQTGFDFLQEPMDRLLEQYSRESVRTTMLKHEEIFRQQVHELHRLYSVQKVLMGELRTKDVKLQSLEANTSPAAFTDERTRLRSSASTSETSHSSYVGNRLSKIAGLSSQEPSICSHDPSRTEKGFNLELPANEGIAIEPGPTVTLQKHLNEAIRSEGDDLWADRESDGESSVELTLSIGCGPDQKRSKQVIDTRNIGPGCSLNPASTSLRLERGEECSNPSAGFEREGLQRPHWLLQALSLNRT